MTLVRCGRITWICAAHSPAISKVKRAVYWLFGRWPSNYLWNPMHHRHARHVDRDLELGVFDRLTVRIGERDSGFAFLRLAGGSKSPLDGDRWPSLRRTSETTNAMARFTARGAAASSASLRNACGNSQRNPATAHAASASRFVPARPNMSRRIRLLQKCKAAS